MTNEIRPIPGSPQEQLLKSTVREVGFGGQAGGGKSYALLLDALYQLHKPGYDAILFRRTYKQLREAGGLIDLSSEIYHHLGGTYNQSNYVWTFPNYHNNTIRFSHLEHEKNIQDFSGSQYPYIGFDELQNFTERQYLFLFSRNRSGNPDINLYIRSTFNPGGIGHFWIKKRFIDSTNLTPKYYKRINGIETETGRNDTEATSRLFIPARLEDNPYLYLDGKGDYERGLSQLDPIDYARLRLGDWDIRRSGRVYHAFTQPGPASYDLDLSKAEGYYHSHDFGAVNHVWGLWAKIGSIYYLIHSEKLAEGTTAARAGKVKSHFRDRKVVAGWGGAKSEKQQRLDYIKEGVKIRLPSITDVEGQINIANKMIEAGKMVICSDQLEVIDDLENTIRDSKEGIQDKSIHHWCDMLRYFAAGINKRGWVR